MGYELSRLLDYFDVDSVEWRLQNAKAGSTRGLAVPYVTNRAIQDRLDDVVGPLNWKNDFRPWHRFPGKSSGEVISQLCGISIWDPDRKEWITKWDGAELSDFEPVKGGLSDSMKRAAVHWGIGRYLYKMDAVRVDIEPTSNGKSVKMSNSTLASLDSTYIKMVEKLKAKEEIPIPNRRTLGLEDPDSHGEAPTAPTAKKKEPPPQQSAPKQGETVPTYLVVDRAAELVSGSAHVKLRTPEGKVVNAFLRGEQMPVQKGSKLTDVKMSPKNNGGYSYFAVTDFKLVA